MSKNYTENSRVSEWFDKTWQGIFGTDSLFGYRPSYSVVRPFSVIIPSVLREVRWAYQRVFWGFDERATWSVDYWLYDIMPKIIWLLRDNVKGVPMDYLPDTWDISDYRTKIGAVMFRERLRQLAVAFEDARGELDFAEKTDAQKKALEMLSEMLHTLWN